MSNYLIENKNFSEKEKLDLALTTVPDNVQAIVFHRCQFQVLTPNEIKAALQKIPEHITLLNFANNDLASLSIEQLKAFFEVIHDKGISKIDLSDNSFELKSDEELKSLRDILNACPNIKEIYFDKKMSLEKNLIVRGIDEFGIRSTGQNTHKMIRILKKLKSLGFNLENNENLLIFNLAIQRAHDAEQIENIFDLIDPKYTILKKNPDIVSNILQEEISPQTLKNILQILKNIDPSLADNKKNILSLLKKFEHIVSLSKIIEGIREGELDSAEIAFFIGKTVGLPATEAQYNTALSILKELHPYKESMIFPFEKIKSKLEKLKNVFILANELSLLANAPFKLYDFIVDNFDCPKLLLDVLGELKSIEYKKRNEDYVPNITNTFLALNVLGFTLEDDSFTYKTALKNFGLINEFEKIYSLLPDLPYSKNLYKFIFDHLEDHEEITRTIEKLKSVKGCEQSLCSDDVEFILKNPKFLNKIENLLSQFKKTPHIHQSRDHCILHFIQNHKEHKKLTKFIEIIEQIGIYQDETLLFLLSITPSLKKINLFFDIIDSLNMGKPTRKELKLLYIKIFYSPEFIRDIQENFHFLTKNKIYFNKYPELFHDVINTLNFENRSLNLETAFYIFNIYEENLLNNISLCRKIIENSFHPSELNTCAQVLSDHNIPSSHKFHVAVIANCIHSSAIKRTLEKLASLDLSYQTTPELYTENTANYIQLIDNLFEQLETIGYTEEKYSPVYKHFASLIAKPNFNASHALKALSKLKETSLQSIEEILKILSEEAKEKPLLLGPINKNQSTHKIEKILNSISQVNPDEIQMRFKAPDSYLLSLPQKNTINLSLLIDNSNLSHLTLEDSVVKKLGGLLEKIIKPEIWTYNYNNIILDLLPITHKKMINIYTTNYYKNINRFFRREELSEKRNFSNSPKDSKDILSCFLIGCLINDALNKIPSTVSQSKKKCLIEKLLFKSKISITDLPKNKIDYEKFLSANKEKNIIDNNEYKILLENFSNIPLLFPNHSMVIRKEIINDETIKIRTSNSWQVPSHTSASASKESAPFVRGEKFTETIIRGISNHYIISDIEKEVLLPHGTQMKTIHDGQRFFSTVVNSPALEKKDRYWSDTALDYAYTHYLSKPYKDIPESIQMEDQNIERPNHGLAHTFRVIENIQHVIDYFSLYAQEEDFKNYCLTLHEQAIEWLRVAAAFSITGRESEASASSNLKRYDEFRQASTEHLKEFLAAHPQKKYHPDAVERISHIVRYMGNPNYEQDLDDKMTINLHPNRRERNRRNYLYRILTISHKLDLPRCYTEKEFEQSIASISKLSEQSTEQQNALQTLIRYNIDLIKAHGDRLYCDIDLNGDYIEHKIDYQDIFAEVSTSMKRVREVAETVPKPEFEPPENTTDSPPTPK